MKNFTKKIGLGIGALLISAGAWSQCATVICPPNITVENDSAACGAVVTYGVPVGFDACSTFFDTIFYTGGIVQYTVPAGVTQISIDARGASGGNGAGGSSISEGLGAIMVGDFTVTPGQIIDVLVGENNNSGNGGGGGTFVVNSTSGNPLIVAGGGSGASGAVDWIGKHGQITTYGADGGGGGGLGGTTGNGGALGASFASGAGGGFFTNGADGWSAGSGGQAYVNGGAGANIGFGIGGFGGGGNGSGNQVGGGGGGYSGGGSGSNSTGAANGGGGGSINNGTNQNNISGVNMGHGMVIFSVKILAPTSLLAGLGNGATYPIGTSTETYVAVVSPSDSATCSFTVTVIDTMKPKVEAIADLETCDPTVSGLTTTTSDNCGGETLAYSFSGATTGSGTGDASGTTFNVGLTTVWYTVTDASGLMDSTSFEVTVHPLPNVSIGALSSDSVCTYTPAFALTTGLPIGGIYSGTGVLGGNYDPSLASIGTNEVIYTYTDTLGCINADTIEIYVDGCASIDELSADNMFDVYPNPSNGVYTVDFSNETQQTINIQVRDAQGRIFYESVSNEENVKEVIDISNVSKGVYFVELKVASEILIKKIIKQ